MNLRNVILTVVAVLAVFLAGVRVEGNAEEEKGAEAIVIPGGSSGNVAFPHRQHQQSLGDCEVCHGLYEEKAGVIEAMKASGGLKNKQVMNTQCTSCHRKMKNAGEKTGPVTCKQCHRT